MNKKSQIYFFAAIILIGMVFVIVSTQPSVSIQGSRQAKNSFENYKYEANIIINNAIYENKNITDELKNYTESFIEYGKEHNHDFRILFIYSMDNNLHIVNYLKDSVLINPTASNLENSQDLVITANSTEITYSNSSYTYRFDPDIIQFRALFVEGD